MYVHFLDHMSQCLREITNILEDDQYKNEVVQTQQESYDEVSSMYLKAVKMKEVVRSTYLPVHSCICTRYYLDLRCILHI